MSNGYARKCKDLRGKGEYFGAFFTDLSKAFDCIDHKQLINKLSWYGVTPKSLTLIFLYLSNRLQGARISNSYGVPQSSVLEPLLFNIDLIDLFPECADDNISRYADDTTPYSCAKIYHL